MQLTTVGATTRKPRVFAAVFVPLLVLYLLSATWSRPYHIDPFSNVLPAWNLATSGSFYLDEHQVLAGPDYLSNLGWIVPARDSVASQYPPGTALLAAPLYAVWPEDAQLTSVSGTNRVAPPVSILVPPLGPAAITAGISVAAAMALLAVLLVELGASARAALLAAYLAGLGTSAWSVAADQLWQHGPAMLWIAAGMVLAARRPLVSGLAFGIAALTRPPTAIIGVSIAAWRSWSERSLSPALRIGVGVGGGVAAFLLYNLAIFGEFSVSAGYGTGFQDNVFSTDLVGWLRNNALGAFSATRGFLVWSPFLLVLVPGIRAAWRAAPAWVRGSAIGGLLYLLVQYKANRYSGGAGFFSYRYPLEALTAAAPLLYLAYEEWVSRRPLMTSVFTVLGGVSVTLHALGAFEITRL